MSGGADWPVCRCADHSGPQRTPEPELFPLFVSGPAPRGNWHGSAWLRVGVGLDMGRLGRILLPFRERARLLPKTLAGAGGYVAARLLCRNGQAIQQEAEQKDRAERSRTTSADRNTFVKTSHSLLCITVKTD